MKFQLENINYNKSQSSFNFFRNEVLCFKSYRHFHPEYELTYIDRGLGIRYIGDAVESYASGDLVLIGGNLPHDYISSEEEHETTIAYVFQFDKSSFNNIPEIKCVEPLFTEARYGIQFENPSHELIEKIKTATDQPSFNNYIIFLEIMEMLSRHKKRQRISSISFSSHTKTKFEQSKIMKATEYISENFQNNITIEQMAKICNMTPTSFCRWFKLSTGHSFITYLNLTRIEKASQLLVLTSYSISSISFQVGYETLSHFNRTFKRIKNTTPREYRKFGRNV